MLGLIGKKLGMTTIFSEEGLAIPVTVLEVGPCTVTQVKEEKKDGYKAVQLGYQDVKEKHLKKPQIGQFKKTNVKPKKYLKEFKIDNTEDYEIGQELKADVFAVGDKVDVSALSKGKGFQGVIKRHGFSGGPKTHGSHFHRAPGSIGQCAWPARVWKNIKLPGQMGNTKVTTQNLKVVDIKPEDNLILVSGAVPGAKNSIVKLTHSVKKKNKAS